MTRMQASISGNTIISEAQTWRLLKNINRSSSYVRARYWALLRAMRQEFLGELLEMEALCSVLCCLHNTQPEMRKLHQLSSKHLRPLILKLQSTEHTMRSMRINEKDLLSLQRLQGTLWPFIEDFKKTAHALRRKAMQERPSYCTVTNGAAPAA